MNHQADISAPNCLIEGQNKLVNSYQYEFTPYLKESNAYGNIYFTHHFEWQGICRERWFSNCVIKDMFSMDGVELEFTPDGLEAAAERALEHQTGARSLRYIIEETLLDVMYELPSLTDVARCIVGREAVEGSEDPVLISESGETQSISLGLMEKSA